MANQTIGLEFETAASGFHQRLLLVSSKTSCSKYRGPMDTKTMGVLVNSISRFIHLVTCKTIKILPIQKNYQDIVSLLKILKPFLDEVISINMPLDELLQKQIEELDTSINEAREFLERWSPKMSKIFSVLQSEPLVMKIQNLSLEICRMLNPLLQSSHVTSYLACVQELQCGEHERLSELIKEAIRYKVGGLMRSSDHLVKIVEALSLTSNQELLAESMALEKQGLKVKLEENKEYVDYTDQVINLVASMRDWMAKLEQFEMINGIPIPSYFRCPLSLEMMRDPVIVATGQTYERSFIQRWIDQGLKICPKTRQTLVHTNLIPNYTVKALIENWCENNNIRPFESLQSNHISPHSLSNGSAEGIAHVESFRSSVHSNSTSHSSLEVGNGYQKEKNGVALSKSCQEELNMLEKNVCYVDHHEILSENVASKCNLSHEQSYSYSRSESISSVVSSIEHTPAAALSEVSRASTRCDEISEVSGEVIPDVQLSAPSNKDLVFSPWLSGNQFHSSFPRTWTENGNGTHQRAHSSPVSVELGSDDLTNSSNVRKLVEDLKNCSNEVQTAAAAELRQLAKNNMENRIIIAKCGAITPLVSLLSSTIKATQENAVTALLNLSINDDNKTLIAQAGAIEPLIQVLMSGTAQAKENSAATLFSLSVLEEYKIKIGRSGAVKALVNLLGNGTLRGKKDAATALFNLSIFHENKARIVQAGAVKYLVELMNPEKGMADKAVALLANLSTISEGRTAITREGGIPLLVEAVEFGSQRGKENAASALFQLCINSRKFCTLVLQEGAVPPLVALSQTGTPRAKEKAQQILSHFRNQREGNMGKLKS